MAHDATFSFRSLKTVRISDEARFMTPVAGWYPDPAGSPELRYWDGQTWTEQMAAGPPPAPVAPPYTAPASYDYIPAAPGPFGLQPGESAPRGVTPQWAPRRSRGRLYAVIAGVVAVAIIAAAVPLALSGGGHSPRTNGAFEAALLTTSEVSETAGGTFTLDTTKDDDEDSSIGCPAADDLRKLLKAPDKAHAERALSDKSAGLSATEFLSYSPGAAAEFKTLEQAYSSCPTLQLSGTTMELTTTVGQAIAGSDETVVLRAHGVIAGRAVGIDIELARFGDCIVGAFYGGLGGPVAIDDAADSLLSKAVAKTKAKNAF